MSTSRETRSESVARGTTAPRAPRRRAAASGRNVPLAAMGSASRRDPASTGRRAGAPLSRAVPAPRIRWPIDQGEWAREFWHGLLEALKIRPRKFYATRHTFISIALTKGVNMKWLAEQCGNSVGTIERHYGKFLVGEAEAQLRLLDPTIGRDLNAPADTKGERKVQTLKARFAVSAEKPLRRKVVPTGIEPVFPT